MTDPATYAYGAELGFEGMDFYVAGRGGALGDVPGRRRRRRVHLLRAGRRARRVGAIGRR